MLRKLLIPLVAVLALFAGLALTPQASAQHAPVPVGDVRCYHVMFRDCRFDPWRCYGRYDCYRDANRAACFLRRQGYDVHIR